MQGWVLALACGGLSEAEEHYNAAVVPQDQGHLEESIAEYDEAIRLDPEFAFAYNNRGIVYFDLGEYQRAIEDYDEAIRLDPERADAYNTGASSTTTLASPSGPSRTTTRLFA